MSYRRTGHQENRRARTEPKFPGSRDDFRTLLSTCDKRIGTNTASSRTPGRGVASRTQGRSGLPTVTVGIPLGLQVPEIRPRSERWTPSGLPTSYVGFSLGVLEGEGQAVRGGVGAGGAGGVPWAAGRSIEASCSPSSSQAFSWLTFVELQPQEQTPNQPLSQVIVPR